ncbi:hypothetical protein [Georgenia subflava]|uniref:DUF4190 domain-containing protein n=1 Tax=Georgenia subflava TaxID=1622177 RepID=A0A6N7EHR6_9MICO|nr:hypothetical protein [Georgenia subflava]MPV35696.1 hypothetical protein [Georgenia subflava]
MSTDRPHFPPPTEGPFGPDPTAGPNPAPGPNPVPGPTGRTGPTPYPAGGGQVPYPTGDATVRPPGPVGASRDNLGTIGLVAAIAGVVLSWVPLLGLAGGVVGVVLAQKGKAAALQGRASNLGVSKAALIVGICAIVLSVLILIGLASSGYY